MWRKPLKHSEKISIALFSAISTFAFAQNGPTPPSPPSVALPSFGGFYTPGTNGFYTGSRHAPPYVPNFQNSQNSQNRVLTESQKKQIEEETADLIGSTENTKINLSAKDMASLESLGLLKKVSASIGANATQSKEDSETLKAILAKLNEIKVELDKNAEEKSQIESEKSPTVLRFTADGVDWTGAIQSAHFSDEEADGSFLFTSDIAYSHDGKRTDETFYLLFSSDVGEGGIKKYNVKAETNGEDAGFFLSRLAQKGVLTATRTGNLVSFRVNESDVSVDMLLSMKKIGQ